MTNACLEDSVKAETLTDGGANPLANAAAVGFVNSINGVNPLTGAGFKDLATGDGDFLAKAECKGFYLLRVTIVMPSKISSKVFYIQDILCGREL